MVEPTNKFVAGIAGQDSVAGGATAKELEARAVTKNPLRTHQDWFFHVLKLLGSGAFRCGSRWQRPKP